MIIRKILDKIQTTEELFCVILIILMVLAAFAQVLIRYVFKIAVAGPEELSRMFQIMITYLGCAVAVREGSQINIDVLANILAKKPAARKIQNIIIYALGIFFGVAFSIYFCNYFVYAITSGQATIGLNIPLAIPIGTMFIGLVLVLIHYVELLIREILHKPASDNSDSELTL